MTIDVPEEPVTPEPSEGGSRWYRSRPFLIGAGVFVALAIAYGADLALSSDKVARGTTVLGVEIGGMDRTDAEAKLAAALGDRVAAPVQIIAGDKTAEVAPADLGLSLDYAKTAQDASDQPLNPFTRIGSLFGSSEAPATVVVADAAAKTGLEVLTKQVAVAPVEGSVTYEGVAVKTTEPVAGQTLDLEDAVDTLRSGWLQEESISLSVSPAAPKTTAAGVQAAAEVATWLVAGPLQLTGEGAVAALTPQQIAGSVKFAPAAGGALVPTFDPEAVTSAAGTALAKTQTEPVDARFDFSTGTVKLVPSVDGRKVDWKATAATISTDAADAPAARKVKVTYALTPPKFTTEAAKKLGVKEKVSEFTTGGFAYDSGQNIKVAAESVNGVVVLPGATFSLNTHTGPRGAEQGYIPAGAIINGQPGKAVGGGISQFATTLYNAYYFAGLTDVTHKPHSYYISRYPAGRDATVFDGQIDIAFKNDTKTAIVIVTRWTESDITVQLWGTKYYEVEAIAGEQYDWSGAQTVTVPYGQPCSASGGSSGFSIKVTRVIKDKTTGKVLKQDEYTTVYAGQKRVICEPAPEPEPESPPDEPPTPPEN